MRIKVSKINLATSKAKILSHINDSGQPPFRYVGKEAAKYIEDYFKTYPGIKTFLDDTVAHAKEMGYVVTLFGRRRPVPELSFAVRELGCIAGIVITASHNPREYNGYKVYWEDGAQVTPPHDTSIMDEVGKVTSFDMVKTMAKEEAVKAGLYEVISDDVDEKYFAQLRNLSIHPEIIKQMAKDIKIVYTPLHGTGLEPVKRVLKDMGFENVYIEPQQAVADGHFPTAPYPNPENPDAWELALKLAKEKDAEWSLVINPDVELRDKSYITKMISAISETHKVAVAASNVILPNGQRQNPMIEPKYWEELLWPIESVTRKIRKNNSYLGADQTGYCEKVSGCCFFIRMSFAEKMGYLDESVFLYCEEPILASRVKKYGYKELYVREITAYHMHHDSEKGNQVNRLRRFRSSRRYYWKEYSGYGKMKLAALMFSDRIYCLIKCKGREN